MSLKIWTKRTNQANWAKPNIPRKPSNPSKLYKSCVVYCNKPSKENFKTFFQTTFSLNKRKLITNQLIVNYDPSRKQNKCWKNIVFVFTSSLCLLKIQKYWFAKQKEKKKNKQAHLLVL